MTEVTMPFETAARLHPIAAATIMRRIDAWRGELIDPPETEIAATRLQMLDGKLQLVALVLTDFTDDEGIAYTVAFAAPINPVVH